MFNDKGRGEHVVIIEFGGLTVIIVLSEGGGKCGWYVTNSMATYNFWQCGQNLQTHTVASQIIRHSFAFPKGTYSSLTTCTVASNILVTFLWPCSLMIALYMCRLQLVGHMHRNHKTCTLWIRHAQFAWPGRYLGDFHGAKHRRHSTISKFIHLVVTKA